MQLLNISEVYQIAINIEKNGIKFYSLWAKKIKDKKLKDIFSALAYAEVEHKKIFEKMLKEIEDYEPKEAYNEEYFQYLRAYSDGLVFDIKKIQKKANEIKTISKAVEFAIDREKDSILYYQEVKNLLPEKYHKEIEKIINEERRHFLDLTHIRNSL
ncbi:MAG: ferritin family protein [Endomicrobia bacterium]|nr:ferritin family protein [Endomicrobiia bacterium]MCX7941382.1 ferritin family protein [Endomicrobiia bacterium]MDW8055919.1 ferritin family protein [Elusimicrobiota bacterium]